MSDDYFKTLLNQIYEASDIFSYELGPDYDGADLENEDGETFDDGAFEREERVAKLIKGACERMGLTSFTNEHHPVLYSEDDREAVICTFDEVTLDQLQALAGLGSNVRVHSDPTSRDAISIYLTVNADIDTVKLV